MSEAPTKRVGRWVLGERLGAGASGTTYRATRDDGATAVAKVMEVAAAEDWKAVERFEREAGVLESLVHPGIPRYLEHVTSDIAVTLFMEEAPGETLAARAARRPIDSATLLALLRQGLEILAFLHSRVPPVLHRDVSPRNLMIDGDRLTLIDFGAVKAALSASTVVTSVGTFGFMAPEQLRGVPERASDLYGLGVSLACAAARCGPDALPVDRASGGYALERLVPRLPFALERTLGQMIAPGLGERCRSADEALALLDHALLPPPVLVPNTDPRPMYADDNMFDARLRMTDPLVGIVALVLLVLAIIVAAVVAATL